MRANLGLPGVALGAELLSSTIGAGLASIVLFSVGIAIIYRIVPTNQPASQMIARPALVVGTFAATFTAVFSVITPQLVGTLQVYGAFVAVFAAMIWLSFISQALLVGAAWVHRRTVNVAALASQDGHSSDGQPHPPS